MSASPLCACAIAAPVPNAIKLTVIHGYLVWKASLRSSLTTVPFLSVSGASSKPVSYRLVVVATLSVVGLGVGVGVAVGISVGVAVGVGVVAAVLLGLGDAVAVGDGVVVGEGVGVGDGCG